MAEIKSSDIPVLPWPAVPLMTPDEVYKGLSEAAREYPNWLEGNVHLGGVGEEAEQAHPDPCARRDPEEHGRPLGHLALRRARGRGHHGRAPRWGSHPATHSLQS